MTFEYAQIIISRLTCPPYTLRLLDIGHDEVLLVVFSTVTDVENGKTRDFSTTYAISHLPDLDEPLFLRLVFTYYLAAVRHEASEQFHFHGKRIFNPHDGEKRVDHILEKEPTL